MESSPRSGYLVDVAERRPFPGFLELANSMIVSNSRSLNGMIDRRLPLARRRESANSGIVLNSSSETYGNDFTGATVTQSQIGLAAVAFGS